MKKFVVHRTVLFVLVVLFLVFPVHGHAEITCRGTGDLGLIIERTTGTVQVVETTQGTVLARVAGLGDLSHASVVFSRDGRYGFVLGRDGGVSKVDLLTGTLVQRIVQAGNSIGGAISQSGRLLAVANYEPGGVRFFATDTLAPVAELPTGSKVVGLGDLPGEKFIFSLFDSNEIWLADLQQPEQPAVRKFTGVGDRPYDGLPTPDGRHYIAGLFGDDGMALLDLWNIDAGVRRILNDYGRGREPRPVYKMPHLRGWAIAGGFAFLPAIGQHEVLVADTRTWQEVARIPVHGQPVFVMARPDGRQIWVNFALPHNDTVQVIDVPSMQVIDTLKPGKGIMHMEFSPRGEQVWLSARDDNRVVMYDTERRQVRGSLESTAPSGIFFTSRAQRIGF
jgi:protein NirF